MPEQSVQTCITSPPYWGLRDYGEDDQLGLEPTPEEYVANMVEVFRAVRRVLRDDGTLWLNLGDSYAGSWGAQSRGGPPSDKSTLAGNGHNGGGPKIAGLSATQIQQHPKRTKTGSWVNHHESLKPKDLVGIPWRVAFALQADGWYLRSDIIWHKPNPMPESVTDRPTKSHEYIFLLTKQPRYYYDADAIREAAAFDTTGQTIRFGGNKYGDSDDPRHSTKSGNPYEFTGGRNKRSVWTVTTKPFSGAHFAVFPPDLIEPCVLAGSSDGGGCSDCGAPYSRVVEKGQPLSDQQRASGGDEKGEYHGQATKDYGLAKAQDASATKARILAGMVERRTVAWEPSCDCDSRPEPQTIIDPFSGAGTTGLVALRHDRSYIGLELNPEYAAMSRERIRDDAPLLNTELEAA